MAGGLDGLAQLRELLVGMERDLGLSSLTRNELDVLYALRRLSAQTGQIVRSELIRNHTLVKEMSQPTFHRSLRALIEKGYIQSAPMRKAGAYVLGPRISAPEDA